MKLKFFVNLLIKSSSLFLGFVISILLAKIFGPSILGFYVIYLTTFNILLIFTKFGQDRFLLREESTLEIVNSSILSSMLIVVIFSLASSVSVSVLLNFNFVEFSLPTSNLVINTAMFLSLIGTAFSALFIARLRARNEVTLANIVESIPFNLLFLLFILILWIADYKNDILKFVILSHGLISAVLALVLFCKYFKLGSNNNYKSLSSIKNQLKIGLSFALITGVTVINASVDTFFISYFRGVNDVAFYNTAQKISSLVSLSLIIGAGMVANRFTYYYSQNKIDELKIIFQKITKLISILSIISFLIVFTIKDYILHIWGAEFLVASSSLLILSFGQMINAFFGPVGLLLNMTGYENMVLKAIISSLVLNLSLNMLLVPYWGIEGAAIATCSAIIFQNIYFYLVMQNKRILVGLK